jgi:glycosyltransferase involved in cell wall biosynthesis
MPKTSLIMTVYNRSQYLSEAIASVLAQADPNWELILWDDGSTDRSPEIAQTFAEQDSRIRFFAAEHRGRAAALIAAHAEAEGEYVGWIDSDDKLTPATLAATTGLLESTPAVGWVYTNYQVIDTKGNIKGDGYRCQIPYSPERMLIDFMTFHFRLIRRSVFERVGGINPNLPSGMDYDLCLRLSEVASVHYLKVPLYLYRSHSDSISGQQRQLQIKCAQTVVNWALERRGLSDCYQIEVDAASRFVLKKITKS